MSFAENFNRICREKGTTPTALLKKMGVATSKVAMWNAGSLPKEDMMVRLADELGCYVMDFFAEESESREVPIIEEPTDEDEADILRIYRSLSRRSKHEFMTMVYQYEAQENLTGDSDSSQTDAV